MNACSFKKQFFIKIFLIIFQIIIFIRLLHHKPIYSQISPTTTPIPTALPSLSPTPTTIPTISPSNTPIPSPTAILHSPTPTIISDKTPELSEIMACPNSGDEWIELYNPHDVDLNLNNWQLNDSYHTIYLYEQEIIPATNFYTIKISRQLNNDGDSITLLNPQNEIIQTFTYDKCQKDNSFIYHEKQWLVSTQPTYNAINIILYPTITKTPTPTQSQNPSNTPIPQKKNTPTITQTEKSLTEKKSSLSKLTPKSSIQLNSFQDSINKLASYSEQLPSNLINENTKKYSFNENTQSKKGIINVIIGGTIFMLLGISGLYENYNQKKYFLP